MPVSPTEIVIDIDCSLPPTAQLIAQIRRAVLCEELRPGTVLPSIRQLANDLGIRAEAVARAYHLLVRDSVVRTEGPRHTLLHPVFWRAGKRRAS